MSKFLTRRKKLTFLLSFLVPKNCVSNRDREAGQWTEQIHAVVIVFQDHQPGIAPAKLPFARVVKEAPHHARGDEARMPSAKEFPLGSLAFSPGSGIRFGYVSGPIGEM
jgi:hypothetical protein